MRHLSTNRTFLRLWQSRIATLAGVTLAVAAVGLGVPAAAGAAPLPAACSQSGSVVTCTYGYTGGEQSFTVPAGITTVAATVIGAAGSPNSAGEPGGAGAEVTGTLGGLTSGHTLYVEVGQTVDTAALPKTARVSAFNGGGAGVGVFSGAGGGASDVRTVSSSTTGSLASRLIVAGGGGGQSELYTIFEPAGAAGADGQPSTAQGDTGQGGFAGTQTSGGAGGHGAPGGSYQGDYPASPGQAGTLGQGGAGAAGTPSAGGGGGGLYGGGGGGAGTGAATGAGNAGSGGGGSSLVPAGGTFAFAFPFTSAAVILSYTVADADLALTTPANITTDATGPSGATVAYPLPTVTDEDSPLPTPDCNPATGTTFAIGQTTVTCSVSDTDDSNSPVSTTFTVTVNGASTQLSALHQAVVGVGPGTSLADKISQAQSYLAAGNTPAACSTLTGFIQEVQAQTGKKIPAATASQLITAAQRIQNVLGC